MSNLPDLFDIQRILPYIEANTLILTPNNRLRSKILQAWGGYQSSLGLKVWETPAIYAIEAWFHQQWKQLQAQSHPESAQCIISNEQQRLIWETITKDCGLMQTEAIAKHAANAFSTLIRWNQPTDKHTIDSGVNSQLTQWIALFKQQLALMNGITPEESFRIIGKAFEQGELISEKAIGLLGFDDISPLLEEQLNKASPSVTTLPLPNHQPLSLQRVQFDNNDEEAQAAARWAHSLLEKDSQLRIGIIVPNLGQSRQHIEQAFIHEFEAHSLNPYTERYTFPFNLSTGSPLGNSPLISSTLQLLRLQEPKQEWDIEFIVHCLFSPFWGRYNEDFDARCALADKLQSLGLFTISGDSLRYWAQHIDEQLNKEITSGIFGYFNHFQQLSTSLNHKGKHLPSQWIDIFLKQLDTLYWPGERIPDSQEYQQTQLWYQLLEAFAGLDNTLSLISSHEALHQLQQMANTLPFQAKVPDSPIQILGILEGAGLHFTHCWIMGLHQQSWPPTPKPNPLLSVHLQRACNMPHSSSLRELHYARSLTENYRHCADNIIFSSPLHIDDNEQTLLPSQLIADIPLSQLSLQATPHSLEKWSQQLRKNNALELVNCEQAPAFTESNLPGGSGLFKSQSENPFDSFVKYRLGAHPPIEPINGFSAIEKGHILHNALAAIWRQLKTQDALLALTDESQNTLVHEQVNMAINDIRRHKPKHLQETLCQLESERQCQLTTRWLDYEKTRPPFTVVSIEETQTVSFDNTAINIRIDRVDQLQDGQFLIIDYKTGEANITAWKGERPKEPQLPLYALTFSGDVKGISFAQININDQSFKGLGQANIAQGIVDIEKNRSDLPLTWEAALAHWNKTLQHLLEEFKTGKCPISYNSETTLQYAKGYLRINRFYEASAIEKLIEQ